MNVTCESWPLQHSRLPVSLECCNGEVCTPAQKPLQNALPRTSSSLLLWSCQTTSSLWPLLLFFIQLASHACLQEGCSPLLLSYVPRANSPIAPEVLSELSPLISQQPHPAPSRPGEERQGGRAAGEFVRTLQLLPALVEQVGTYASS